MAPSDLEQVSLPVDDDAETSPQTASGRMRGLALAIAVTALASGVLTGLVLYGTARVIVDRPQDCAVVADADARLACYDDSVHRTPSQPAHGALAPSPTKF